VVIAGVVVGVVIVDVLIIVRVVVGVGVGQDLIQLTLNARSRAMNVAITARGLRYNRAALVPGGVSRR
jgi:hypothetical protein